MSSPYGPYEHRHACAHADAYAFAAADVLRQVARRDGHTDFRRGDVSISLGGTDRDVQPQLTGAAQGGAAAQALLVADAIDRATDNRM